MNIDATYILKIKDWDRNCFNEHKIRCVVIGESKTQYKIKILQPTHNRKAGDLLWVRKHNVILSEQRLGIHRIEQEDAEEPWWNKI